MEKNRKKALTFILILSSIFILLLLGIYFGVSIYFKGHFFPKTTIGTLECSGKTAQWATDHNLSIAEDYLLTIYDRDGNKYHLLGMDFSYTYENLGEETAALTSQSYFAWPMEVMKEHTYSLQAGYVFNNEELTEQIRKLPIFDSNNWIEPTNASIQITSEGFEVVPEIEGNIPIEETVIAQITEAINQGLTTITLTDSCYQSPEITQTSKCITDAAQQIRSYMNSTIHYEIENANENLTSQQILSMLTIDENFQVSINTQKIDWFVQTLASKYNTYGDVREFQTTQGDTIKVGGGDYGWVIAKVKEAQQILIDLEGGVPVSREPVYEQTAKVSGIYDIGDTYIEIDYTNQHMWYYQEGTVVLESDIVSGLLKTGNGSPDGIYKVVYKERNAKLQGESYVTPVDYFIPFAYNVGFHDADWQSKFGGDVYTYNGSHGCVNMPLDTVSQLYQMVEIDTPVVAYYREPVKLTSESAQISNAFSYYEEEETSSNTQ